MATRTKIAIGVLVSLLLIGAGWTIWSALHTSKTSPVTTKNTQATYTSLDFYSADIPFQTRSAIEQWLTANSGVSGLNNTTVTVRKGTYTKTFSPDGSLYTVRFLVDLTGTPHVTYAIHVDLSPANHYAPLIVTCPPASEQIGNPADCKGMTQI